jgi:hypothetical protein
VTKRKKGLDRINRINRVDAEDQRHAGDRNRRDHGQRRDQRDQRRAAHENNTIYTGGERASYVLLPMIPARDGTTLTGKRAHGAELDTTK